ncbi:MAG: helix-turn-helix transcriptional regulator [Acidiferrobacterales bacterium]
MDRTERFYKITQMLGTQDVVPRETLLDELGVSLATFKRDLEYMRERLHAPIIWDRERRGYRLRKQSPHGARFQLPGIWFNASEAHALLTIQHLLAHIEPGVLAPHIESLKTRIESLLDQGDHSVDELRRRIRILSQGARPVIPRHFAIITTALLSRKRLRILYYHRKRDEQTERELSPQRLVHYRDNWYLDAWCHRRDGLRTFAVDAIRKAELLEKESPNVSEGFLNMQLGAGYGIFAGNNTQVATLRFSPTRSRWVATERWHPEQRGAFDAQGRYVLEIPYTDDLELVMDILKYGSDVEVLEPTSLRDRVTEALRTALCQYDDGDNGS